MVRNKSQLGGGSVSGSPLNNGRSPARLKTSSRRSTIVDSDEEDAGGALVHPHGLRPSRTSVHKQNLYIVSFPLIFLFNVLRSILYQLFVIFKHLYSATSRIIIHRQPTTTTTLNRKRECGGNFEVIVNSDAAGNNPQTNVLLNGPPSDFIEMSTHRPAGPGPADPLLAKQKHHHRRAFEYISKALKMDEENEG